jgi:hypothetical protein
MQQRLGGRCRADFRGSDADQRVHLKHKWSAARYAEAQYKPGDVAAARPGQPKSSGTWVLPHTYFIYVVASKAEAGVKPPLRQLATIHRIRRRRALDRDRDPRPPLSHGTQHAKSRFRSNGEENERICSKIFYNRDFGYIKLTIERPLRLNFQASSDRLARLDHETAFANLAESAKRKDKLAIAEEVEAGRRLQDNIKRALGRLDPGKLYQNREAFEVVLDEALRAEDIRIAAPVRKANLSFFLSLATFRMRSSACGMLVWLCAQGMVCWPAFPLVSALGSTDSAAVGSATDCSAAGRSALFAGFSATMTESDFSCPCIIGYGSSPSRCGPSLSLNADGQSRDIPASDAILLRVMWPLTPAGRQCLA